MMIIIIRIFLLAIESFSLRLFIYFLRFHIGKKTNGDVLMLSHDRNEGMVNTVRCCPNVMRSISHHCKTIIIIIVIRVSLWCESQTKSIFFSSATFNLNNYIYLSVLAYGLNRRKYWIERMVVVFIYSGVSDSSRSRIHFFRLRHRDKQFKINTLNKQDWRTLADWLLAAYLLVDRRGQNP